MSHVHRQGSGLSKSHKMKREHAKHRAKITGDTEGLVIKGRLRIGKALEERIINE